MNQKFQLFSQVHIAILMALLIIIILMYIFKDMIFACKFKKFTGYIIAFFLFIIRASEQICDIMDGTWDIKSDLPLHLCGITSVICIVMLITQSYAMFQVMYFWGLIGSPIAMIIPGDFNYTYNSPEFWQFMIAHSLNIIAVVFMIFAYKYRPTVKSIWKTFSTTNIYMVFIACFNYIVGSNYYYFYLCSDPSPLIPNPFKNVSSWPLILLLLEAVTLFSILLFYSPYAISDRIKMSKRTEAHI